MLDFVLPRVEEFHSASQKCFGGKHRILRSASTLFGRMQSHTCMTDCSHYFGCKLLLRIPETATCNMAMIKRLAPVQWETLRLSDSEAGVVLSACDTCWTANMCVCVCLRRLAAQEDEGCDDNRIRRLSRQEASPRELLRGDLLRIRSPGEMLQEARLHRHDVGLCGRPRAGHVVPPSCAPVD